MMAQKLIEDAGERGMGEIPERVQSLNEWVQGRFVQGWCGLHPGSLPKLLRRHEKSLELLWKTAFRVWTGLLWL